MGSLKNERKGLKMKNFGFAIFLLICALVSAKPQGRGPPPIQDCKRDYSPDGFKCHLKNKCLDQPQDVVENPKSTVQPFNPRTAFCPLGEKCCLKRATEAITLEKL